MVNGDRWGSGSSGPADDLVKSKSSASSSNSKQDATYVNCLPDAGHSQDMTGGVKPLEGSVGPERPDYPWGASQAINRLAAARHRPRCRQGPKK